MKCLWCTSVPCSYCRTTPAEDRAALAGRNARFRSKVQAIRLAQARRGIDALADAVLGAYTPEEIGHLLTTAARAGV